jgi:AcrR family transcriptional regulator
MIEPFGTIYGMPVAKGATLDPQRTRNAIIDVAADLFYAGGLDGTGIAELCARAGISKETLYRHFGSKEGLVQAVLTVRSNRVARWLRDAAQAAGDDPASQLAAVFDALGRWYEEPSFRGCAIVNAAVQQHGDPASSVAVRHLHRHLDLLSEIATRAGAADVGLLARQLLMLIEGATVVADHLDIDDPAREAKQAALALLHASVARTAG